VFTSPFAWRIVFSVRISTAAARHPSYSIFPLTYLLRGRCTIIWYGTAIKNNINRRDSASGYRRVSILDTARSSIVYEFVRDSGSESNPRLSYTDYRRHPESVPPAHRRLTAAARNLNVHTVQEAFRCVLLVCAHGKGRRVRRVRGWSFISGGARAERTCGPHPPRTFGLVHGDSSAVCRPTRTDTLPRSSYHVAI